MPPTNGKAGDDKLSTLLLDALKKNDKIEKQEVDILNSLVDEMREANKTLTATQAQAAKAVGVANKGLPQAAAAAPTVAQPPQVVQAATPPQAPQAVPTRQQAPSAPQPTTSIPDLFAPLAKVAKRLADWSDLLGKPAAVAAKATEAPVARATTPQPSGAPVQQPAAPKPPDPFARLAEAAHRDPNTYGLKPETASGTDSTYGLKPTEDKPTGEAPRVQTAGESLAASIAGAFAPLTAGVQGIFDLLKERLAAATGGTKAAKKAKAAKEPKLPRESVQRVGLGDYFGQGKQAIGEAPGKALKAVSEKAAESPALAGLAQSFGAAASAIGALTGAAGAAVGAFQSLASQVVGFVQAFNPSVVELLNQAIGDLTATLGVAFQPLVEGMTVLARELGATLLPVMRQLQPVFAQLTQVVIDATKPFIESFGKIVSMFAPFLQSLVDVAKSLLPLAEAFATIYTTVYQGLKPSFAILVGIIQAAAVPLQLFGQVLNAVAPLIEVFGAVMAGIAEAISSAISGLLGGDKLKGAFDGLRAAMEKFAQGLVLSIAVLGKLLGFDDFVDGFVEALKKPEKQSNVGLKAASNVGFQSFEAFSKSIAAAAFKATGANALGKQDHSTADWLKDIHGTLDKIASGDLTDTLIQPIVDKLEELGQALADIAELVRRLKPPAWDDVKEGKSIFNPGFRFGDLGDGR